MLNGNREIFMNSFHDFCLSSGQKYPGNLPEVNQKWYGLITSGYCLREQKRTKSLERGEGCP